MGVFLFHPAARERGKGDMDSFMEEACEEEEEEEGGREDHEDLAPSEAAGGVM